MARRLAVSVGVLLAVSVRAEETEAGDQVGDGVFADHPREGRLADIAVQEDWSLVDRTQAGADDQCDR
jgi:hypothetical protein